MVSPLARSLAPTHGTCSSHNMHAVHKSPWPCQVTAQAAQIVAHSMTSVSGGRISARLHPSSVHRDTQSYRAEALPSHTLAARSHDEPRAGQRVEDDHHLQRDVDGIQSCCHRRPAAGIWPWLSPASPFTPVSPRPSSRCAREEDESAVEPLTKKASGRVATLARLRGNLTRQPRAALMN